LVRFLESLIQYLNKCIIYFLDVTASGFLDVIRSQEGIKKFACMLEFLLSALVKLAGNLQ